MKLRVIYNMSEMIIESEQQKVIVTYTDEPMKGGKKGSPEL